jgi:ribosome biogenesis GTPase
MTEKKRNNLTLLQLGWRPFFQQQLGLEEWEYPAFRVIAQYRDRLELLGEQSELGLDLHPDMPPITVGDWLLLTPEGRFGQLLERQSLFRRKAAGSKVAEQLIAANVDTLFVVTSLNEDFNLSRIERYLSLANEAGTEPVVILSKADLCDDPESLCRQVQALDPLLMVETVNCLDADEFNKLKPWCGAGMPHGGLLLDTPGMRELQLVDCDEGVTATFSDINSLAEQCRFGNCQHASEPGCAVQDAISRGELEVRRLSSFQKLKREQAFNSATLAEKRARDKSFGKLIKAHLSDKKNRKC